MGLGQNIRAARKSAGMTQAELAQKCGLATITIRQYEAGKREPRQEQLRCIASALGASMSALLAQEPSALEGLLDGTVSPMDIADEMSIPLDVVWRAINTPEQVPQEIREKIGAVGAALSAEFSTPENQRARSAMEEISFKLYQLNNTGLQKAVERVSELAEIPKYRRDNGGA